MIRFVQNYLLAIIFINMSVVHVCLFARSNFNTPDESQNDLKSIFDSRKLQLEFFTQRLSVDDSSIYMLQEEAIYFAQQEDYQTALDLLDHAIDIMDSYSVNSPDQQIHNSELLNTPVYSEQIQKSRQWTIELGSDYSRQEYEMNFIESDSVVLEELNNPFVSLRFSNIGKIKNKNFNMFNFVRADRDLIQTNMSTNLESGDFSRYWRLEGVSDLFWQYRENSGSFWENQFRTAINLPAGVNDRINLYSNTRYKYYFPPDSIYNNLLYSDLSLSFRRYLNLTSWLELSIKPSYYKEQGDLSLAYSQAQGIIDINHRPHYRQYYALQLNLTYRDFDNKEPTEIYSNRYYSFFPNLEVEIPLYKPLGLQTHIDLESRRYTNPDITYSNYYYGLLSNQLKYYINDFDYIGFGYVYEFETHHSKEASEQNLIEQENFHANGLIVSLNILRMNGFMFFISYQFTLRTYPNAGETDFLGYYSNRRIHNIQGIGHMPISKRWRVQFFTNYDNDRDRDHDANDNFNTIFNIGLIYSF